MDMTGWKRVQSLEEVIEMATQIGVSIAFEKFEFLQMENFKQKQQRRIDNTRELLKHYRKLRLHAKKAVYKGQYSKRVSPIEILDDIDNSEPELIIDSIKKSSAQTYIIISHIGKMIEIYKQLAYTSKDEIEINKYKSIEAYYINPNKSSIEKIAENMSYSSRQIERYIDDAIEDISGLIFGIESLKIKKFMSKTCRRSVN